MISITHDSRVKARKTTAWVDYAIPGLQSLSGCADIRNTSKLEFFLVQLRRIFGTIAVRRTWSTIRAHGCPLDALQTLWPVARSDASIERCLLLDQVFLCRSRGRGVACVDAHTDFVALGRDVVVRYSGIPYDKIAWARGHAFELFRREVQRMHSREMEKGLPHNRVP